MHPLIASILISYSIRQNCLGLIILDSWDYVYLLSIKLPLRFLSNGCLFLNLFGFSSKADCTLIKNVPMQKHSLNVVWNCFCMKQLFVCLLHDAQTLNNKTIKLFSTHSNNTILLVKCFVWSCVPRHQAKLHNQQAKCLAWHFVWSVWIPWQLHQICFNMLGDQTLLFAWTGNIQLPPTKWNLTQKNL